jgi:hypothetical protein
MKARENPFATDRILRVRYRPQEMTWDQILARLASLRYRAAIVGPHGSGKTTLLEDLEPLLLAQGFELRRARLDTESPRLARSQWRQLTSRLTDRHIILFDGAELMPRLLWPLFRWPARHAGGLIVTSHRPGLLPTLIETTTSPRLLSQIVTDILPCPDPSLDAGALYRRHAGNLREALRELYDSYAVQAQ